MLAMGLVPVTLVSCCLGLKKDISLQTEIIEMETSKKKKRQQNLIDRSCYIYFPDCFTSESRLLSPYSCVLMQCGCKDLEGHVPAKDHE